MYFLRNVVICAQNVLFSVKDNKQHLKIQEKLIWIILGYNYNDKNDNRDC